MGGFLNGKHILYGMHISYVRQNYIEGTLHRQIEQRE